jgi:hypothetical protein
MRCALVAPFVVAASAQATTVSVSFDKLAGQTGGTPAQTAVYRASLSGTGLDTLRSISIADNSGGLGGAAGRFSGFDLDAIILSYDFATSASEMASITPIAVFDYVNGSVFTPGTQRPPTDPSLFGTINSNKVDNSVATLGSFDANSTTGSSADGFMSLGDLGRLGFNLTADLLLDQDVYLYIGEVGDNGEVAAGSITISSEQVPVIPLPSGSAMAGLGMLVVATRRRR